MINKIKIAVFGVLMLFMSFSSWAQYVPQEEVKSSRAWEIGIGGSMFNWTRVSVTGFQNLNDAYKYDLKINHILGGGNLYVARELNPWLYLDLQGYMGMAKNELDSDKKYDYLFMGGPGLQLRLNQLFKSQYVEPFLRVGVNYLYKDFSAVTKGSFEDDITGQAGWTSTDTWNPNGKDNDKKSYFPVALGLGVNSWLNNSIGIGVQGDYLMPVQKDMPKFAQVTLRLLFRFGGKDKRPMPERVVEYQTIEKPVEVEKIVERIVEKEVPAPVEKVLCDLFYNINFEFDEYVFTAQTESVLDEIAEVLKQYDNEHFLITGFTDAKGSDEYNNTLSANRANAVVEALKKRGVNSNSLKSRGVGKRAAAMGENEPNEARLGDRKVTIEVVKNQAYWDRLPK